jgi:hypothetical protein
MGVMFPGQLKLYLWKVVSDFPIKFHEFIFLTGRGKCSFLHSSDSVSSAVTLFEHGIIGTSPIQPQLGFTIETLCFYRQLRRVCPRFSLDAFAKALNFYHAVSNQKLAIRDLNLICLVVTP